MADIEQLSSTGSAFQSVDFAHHFKHDVALIVGSCLVLSSAAAVFVSLLTFHSINAAESISLVGFPLLWRSPHIAKRSSPRGLASIIKPSSGSALRGVGTSDWFNRAKTERSFASMGESKDNVLAASCVISCVARELRQGELPMKRSDLEKGHSDHEHRVLSSNSSGQGLDVLAEVGPVVAILKPRGLPVNEGQNRGCDCVINRLVYTSGSKWRALKRLRLPKNMCGIVCCAKASEASAADEALHDVQLELWFDILVYAEGVESLLEKNLLPLPCIGTEAMLEKLYEVGRFAHICAKVVVTGGTTSADAADALADAFARADCRIVDKLKGGYRPPKSRGGLENVNMMVLARVLCSALGSIEMLPDTCLQRLLVEERAFVAEEARKNAYQTTVLIDLLSSSKAVSHDEYAPELQRLKICQLGKTPEAARNALDRLGLLPPLDTAWTSHAYTQLQRHVMEQWLMEKRATTFQRQKLRYGKHTHKLLCCYVRVQRDGLLPMEWLTPGACIDHNKSLIGLNGPLRGTVLRFDRGNHCEVRALNEAYSLCTERSLTGKGCVVDLIVTHQPCVSCAAAMCNFAAMLPDSQLNVGFRDWRLMQRALSAALRDGGKS